MTSKSSTEPRKIIENLAEAVAMHMMNMSLDPELTKNLVLAAEDEAIKDLEAHTAAARHRDGEKFKSRLETQVADAHAKGGVDSLELMHEIGADSASVYEAMAQWGITKGKKGSDSITDFMYSHAPDNLYQERLAHLTTRQKEAE